MADVVLGFALKKISNFLSEKGTLLGGLRHEVQLMNDEFGHIKAFLEKMAGFNQEDDPQLSEWIRQVREVSYDTQDILDEFTFLSAGFHGCIQGAFKPLKTMHVRHRLASKLHSVKARVKNIAEARLRYESHYANVLPQALGRVAAKNPWRHSKDDDALLVGEAELVGVAEPKKHLIHHFLDDVGSQLKAIAVLGMGGLGKTTLAKQVYEDAAVKKHFQIRVWVTVSQHCDFHILLKGLIEQLLTKFNEPIPPQMDSMDMCQSKAVLKDLLRRGRYIILFDDVWDVEFWNAFQFVLPESSCSGNRVVFTTRIADVAFASTAKSQGYVYRMGFLSFQDSWTLFCKKIFKGGDCPDHLNNVAESIVAKCGGLPLAILAVGGLLASRDTCTTNEWELVLKRIGSEFEGAGKLDRVKRILSLSYNDLPSTLKACLLYTSIYPDGHSIKSFLLIQLLVAEGFVEQKEGQTAEESAWDCFKELANRSLIQINKAGYHGTHCIIDVHDLLREFIASKSRDQNMATLITGTEQIRAGWSPLKVVRRLVLNNNLLEIANLESYLCIKKCRSIIYFGGKELVSKAAIAKLLTSKLLTVLDLSGMDLEEIPKEIFKLFHLKNLAISGKRITTVPKSIKRLQNLQCLIMKETNVRELCVEIQKLHKLSHLLLAHQAAYSLTGNLPYNGFKAPSGIGKLTGLQTLSIIDVGESDKSTRIVSEIGKLSRLRSLWLTNLRREDGEELCHSLEKLTYLQELVVASPVKKDEIISLDKNHPVSASFLQSLSMLELYGRLENMPPWIRNLQELERISLSLSKLVDDPLETLQHLPNLFEVWLNDASMGENLCFRNGHFLKVKRLSLKNMKGLRGVKVEKGAMPGIEVLVMQQLPLLEELPAGIEYLRQLQKLDLRAMNSQLVNKLENEEDSEDCKKISHIPQVKIASFIDGKWKCHWLSRQKKGNSST